MGVGGGGRGLQLFPPQDLGGDPEAEATQPSPTQTAGTGRGATPLPPPPGHLLIVLGASLQEPSRPEGCLCASSLPRRFCPGRSLLP